MKVQTYSNVSQLLIQYNIDPEKTSFDFSDIATFMISGWSDPDFVNIYNPYSTFNWPETIKHYRTITFHLRNGEEVRFVQRWLEGMEEW